MSGQEEEEEEKECPAAQSCPDAGDVKTISLPETIR